MQILRLRTNRQYIYNGQYIGELRKMKDFLKMDTGVGYIMSTIWVNNNFVNSFKYITHVTPAENTVNSNKTPYTNN